MHALALLVGAVFLAVVLLDAFQTIILPRRPAGRLRITRIFYLLTWTPWRWAAGRVRSRAMREQAYSIYGPMSLLLLFVLWALLLLSAYALLYFGLRTPFGGSMHVAGRGHLRDCLYLSGTTLFTLGLGDIVPVTYVARALIVLEAGTGLGFIALVIGYVPVLYTAFSHREITVALLDARAGSPPTAGELIVRHSFNGGHRAMTDLLGEWERWSAELLETHVSYPLLCYYRSQHDNQSWLSAITSILDTCALLITMIEGPSTRQAQLTFAVARHALVDLGHVFHLEAEEVTLREGEFTRLHDDEFARLCDRLGEAGYSLCSDRGSRERLNAIRKLYEPHAEAMGRFLCLDMPLWVPAPPDPEKKPNLWNSVAALRSPAALTDRLSTHISPQSAASRLHDDEQHLL